MKGKKKIFENMNSGLLCSHPKYIKINKNKTQKHPNKDPVTNPIILDRKLQATPPRHATSPHLLLHLLLLLGQEGLQAPQRGPRRPLEGWVRRGACLNDPHKVIQGPLECKPPGRLLTGQGRMFDGALAPPSDPL